MKINKYLLSFTCPSQMFLLGISKKEINFINSELRTVDFKFKGKNFLIAFDKKFNYFDEENLILESKIHSSNNKMVTTIASNFRTWIDDSNKVHIKRLNYSGMPIFYFIDKEYIFFSSHIKLLKSVGIVVEENVKSLPEFFVYRYIIPPNTIFKDIFQLEAGSEAIIDVDSLNLKVNNFFNPFNQEKKNISHNDLLIAIQDYFEGFHNCDDRMAVLLSGGLDSSILFSISKNILDINESYSSVYPFDNRGDEYRYATSAANLFDSNHHLLEYSNEDFLKSCVLSISAVEEPIHHLQTAIFNLMFEKGIPPNRDLVIFGEGADGIFGNSMHYFYKKRQEIGRFLKLIPNSAIDKLSLKNNFMKKINNLKKTYLPFNSPDNYIWQLGSYGSEKWTINKYNCERLDIIENRYHCIQKTSCPSIFDIISCLSMNGEGFVTQSIWWKIAHHHGKLALYPFMNTNLLKKAFEIPWSIKLKSKKYLLKRIAQDIGIDKNIINRPKKAFGVDSVKWSMPGQIFEKIKPATRKIVPTQTINQVQSSDPKKAMIFWNLINYAIWHRLIIDDEPPELIIEDIDDEKL